MVARWTDAAGADRSGGRRRNGARPAGRGRRRGADPAPVVGAARPQRRPAAAPPRAAGPALAVEGRELRRLRAAVGADRRRRRRARRRLGQHRHAGPRHRPRPRRRRDAATLVAEVERALGPARAAARAGSPTGSARRRTSMARRLAAYFADPGADRREGRRPRCRCGSTSAGPSSAAASTGSSASRDGGLRVVDLKTGSSKPKADDVRPHRAARRLPAGRRAAGRSGPRATLGRRGAAAARQGRRHVTGHHAPAAGAARGGRRPRVGARARRGDGRGDGRRRVRGDARARAAPLPGQDSCPALPEGRRRDCDCTRPTRRASTLADGARAARRRPPSSWPSSRRRCARCSSWPAPGRARPRRWPRASSGWSPTASSTRPGARSHLHPQGRGRARRAHRPRACAALREAGIWTPRPGRGRRRACSTACPPCRPTTRMPGGSCASTRCGWGRARAPAAHRGGRVAVRARGGRVAGTAPMDGVDKAESTVIERRRRPRRRDGRAPRRRRTTSAGYLDEFEAALAGVPKGVQPKRRARPMVTRRPCRRCATGGRCCPWSTRYHDLKRSRDAMDFADQMALAARLAAVGAAVGATERAAVPGGAARRVPGHLRGAAAAAAVAVRGSRRGLGDRCRSPRSATRTSRSTAGAARARRP